MQMFNPLQQVYIDSLKNQLKEAEEILKEVDKRTLYYPQCDFGAKKQVWLLFRSNLKHYKKKYWSKK